MYSLAEPLSAFSINSGFLPPYTALQPIPGLTIDAFTGEVNVTPTQQGIFDLAVLIEAYNENGVLTGTVLYDLQIVVVNCNNQNPMPLQPNAVTIFDPLGSGAGFDSISNTIGLCSSDQFCMDVQFTDPDVNDTVYLSTNLLDVLPNATFTVSGTNPATATICWTSQTTLLNIPVTIFANDSVCPVNGSNSYSFAVIRTPDLSVSVNHDSICGNMEAQFNAEGAAPVVWTVLSGDPIQEGINFSCDTCSNPMASPDSTTTYIVNDASACVNADTVTIFVSPDNLGHIDLEILNLGYYNL